jgi:hypothetical protein
MPTGIKNCGIWKIFHNRRKYGLNFLNEFLKSENRCNVVFLCVIGVLKSGNRSQSQQVLFNVSTIRGTYNSSSEELLTSSLYS